MLCGINEKITVEAMKVYDGMFTVAIPMDILRAIAALVDRELPASPEPPSCTVLPASCLVEV
jgi:hypothetical protein